MTGWLWLLVTVGGVALLGFAIARGMIVTRRRRESAVAQRRTGEATKDLYEQEEAEREREEEPEAERAPRERETTPR
jgi:hypothetical protein